MVDAARRIGVVIVVAMTAGACASADRMTLSNRFVRQGTPAVDLGGPRPASLRPGDRHGAARTARVTHLPAAAANSLESSDPLIRQALAKLVTAPTSEHYLDVADAYLRRRVFDRAHDFLMRSLQANGPNAAVYDSLARLWRDWGQPGEGLAHAHRGVYLAPRSPVGHNTLGTVLYRMGRTADARASFSRAVELDPAAWYALANLCHLNMAAGDTRTAIGQCRKATALRKAASIKDDQ